ncbi:MAG: hypothetical protein LBM25_07770 [Bacteroidales bacterium]|jgi:hypothetical protein|nr:hypothetical protein [Bacteroidales bacterium]
MTQQQINYLIALPKLLDKNGILNDTYTMIKQEPFQKRYTLKSPLNNRYTFLYNVDQSSKNYLKLTLHLMDNDTKIGLLRIDFNGQHQNPENINDDVPNDFRPFAGKFFAYNEPHLHYYVKGYKPLSWAKPLSKDYPVQNISSFSDVINAFIAFNSLISLKTNFIINPVIL